MSLPSYDTPGSSWHWGPASAASTGRRAASSAIVRHRGYCWAAGRGSSWHWGPARGSASAASAGKRAASSAIYASTPQSTLRPCGQYACAHEPSGERTEWRTNALNERSYGLEHTPRRRLAAAMRSAALRAPLSSRCGGGPVARGRRFGGRRAVRLSGLLLDRVACDRAPGAQRRSRDGWGRAAHPWAGQ